MTIVLFIYLFVCLFIYLFIYLLIDQGVEDEEAEVNALMEELSVGDDEELLPLEGESKLSLNTSATETMNQMHGLA